MSRSIPTPVRAAVGLASVAIDSARQLPHRLISLPVRTAGTAVQTSLRIQQHYTSLVNRGDELLSQISSDRETGTPSWAQFDDDVEAAEETTESDLSSETPGLPLPNYPILSIPQLRARLRKLTEADLVTLLEYERSHAERPAYLTALENRLAVVRNNA